MEEESDKFPTDDARAPYSILSSYEESLLYQGYTVADIQRLRDSLNQKTEGS